MSPGGADPLTGPVRFAPEPASTRQPRLSSSSKRAEFRLAFAHTLRRVDRLHPALLVVCLVSTIGFAVVALVALGLAVVAALSVSGGGP
jgi:hypothetical protein